MLELFALADLTPTAKALIAFGGGVILCALWASFAARWL